LFTATSTVVGGDKNPDNPACFGAVVTKGFAGGDTCRVGNLFFLFCTEEFCSLSESEPNDVALINVTAGGGGGGGRSGG